MAVFDSDTNPYPIYDEGTPTRRRQDRQPTVGDVAGAFGSITGVKPYTDAVANLADRAAAGIGQVHTANQQYIRDPTGAIANANQFLRESTRGNKTPSSIPSFDPQLPNIRNPIEMVASHSADPRDVAISARRTLGSPQPEMSRGFIRNEETGQQTQMESPISADGGSGIFRGTPSSSTSGSGSHENPISLRNIDEPNYITVDQARDQGIGRKAMAAINNQRSEDYRAKLGERIGEMTAMKTHTSSSTSESTGGMPGDPQATPLNDIQKQHFGLNAIITDPNASPGTKEQARQQLNIIEGRPEQPKQQIVNIPGPIDPDTLKPIIHPSILNPDGKTATPISMTSQTQQPARKPIKGDTAFDKDGNAVFYDGTGWLLKK